VSWSPYEKEGEPKTEFIAIVADEKINSRKLGLFIGNNPVLQRKIRAV
jgi:hypothetical protein